MVERQHRTGVYASQELLDGLVAEGLFARVMPGGDSGSDPIEMWTLFSELERMGAPYDDLAVSLIVAAIVNKIGTDFQREQVVTSILSGQARACLGYSEPDSGSDVAACVTKAVRDGDEWVIDGAKMWTSLGQVAQWMLLLTRTDPDVPKHKGLTFFLVPMDTPGVSLQPVHTMGDEVTNATFLDNVRLSDAWRLGEVNRGWGIMAMGIAFERGVMGGTGNGIPLLRSFWNWATAEGRDSDPAIREFCANLAIENHVAMLLTQKAAWIAATGGLPGAEGSMVKYFANESYQRATEKLMDLCGPAGLLGFHVDGAAADGWIEYNARHAPVTTIYGGTTEVSRNAVAELHLELPRSR